MRALMWIAALALLLFSSQPSWPNVRSFELATPAVFVGLRLANFMKEEVLREVRPKDISPLHHAFATYNHIFCSERFAHFSRKPIFDAEIPSSGFLETSSYEKRLDLFFWKPDFSGLRTEPTDTVVDKALHRRSLTSVPYGEGQHEKAPVGRELAPDARQIRADLSLTQPPCKDRSIFSNFVSFLPGLCSLNGGVCGSHTLSKSPANIIYAQAGYNDRSHAEGHRGPQHTLGPVRHLPLGVQILVGALVVAGSFFGTLVAFQRFLRGQLGDAFLIVLLGGIAGGVLGFITLIGGLVAL